MTSTPVTRGVELRQKLKQASKGAIIHLEKGHEYQGPFILDRPITLVGHSETTQLFAKGCPAVVVLSPDVRLEHLGVVNSFDPTSGVCLLVEQNAHPVLVDVKTCGRTETMTREHIVDLGEILSQQPAISFFEVEVSGPSLVKCAANSAKWLRIGPDTLPAAGKYLIQVLCDAKSLGPDAIAIGNVDIVTGATTRTFWVTAHVILKAPTDIPTGEIALLLGKDQRIRFAEGFLIGKSRFPGLSAASSMAERQAVILREPSRTWAIFQPWLTPSPTLLNGTPLALGRRVLLQEGHVIRAGSLDLKVEVPKGASNYLADKMLLDLGTPSGQPPDTGFQLRYNGGGKDKATVVSTVPWVQVSPAEIELKKGEVKAIQVSLTPAVANLPPIKHRERGAVLVWSKNEILSLDVSVDVKAETIIPRVSDSLKFGTVTDWANALATVTIFNDGTKEWHPTIKADQEWLLPEFPTITVPGGKSAALTVRLSQKVENLAPASEQAGVMTLEGDGVTLQVKVSARLQLASPEPVWESPPPDFKEIDDWEQARPVTLIVRNKGGKDWQATVRAAVPWLDIQTTSLVLPAGGQKSFVVQVNGKLPVGMHNVPNAIMVEGVDRSLAIGAQVTLKPPTSIVEVFPRQVDFGQFDDWKAAGPQRIEFKNLGGAEWLGSITCSIPWLDIAPPGNQWRCAPKSETALTLRINDRIIEGQHSIPGAIVFEGPGGPYRVQVQANYEPRPKIHAVQSVDFGEVAGWDTAPPLKIALYNDGTKDWTASVQVSSATSWLSVNPQTLRVPQGGQAELEVRLNEQLNRLAAGSHTDPQAILLTGNRIDQYIAVKVTLPPFELQIRETEVAFHIEEGTDLANVRQTLRLSNSGRRHWAGTIETRVPWLTVNPARAEIRAGTQLDVEVRPTEAIRSLGTGEQFFGSVIALAGTSASLGARVSIEKKPLDIMPEIEPSQLDFGTIEEEGTLAADQQLRIRVGRDWQATIKAQDDWFEPVVSTLSGPANARVPMAVRLTERAKGLSEGVHWGELRVNIAGGPSSVVPVKIAKIELPPSLGFEPQSVEFRLDPAKGVFPTQRVRVNNRTKKAWSIVLEVSEPWLSVAPATIQCPSYGSAEFEIALTPQVSSLKYGEYRREIVLRVGRHRIAYPVEAMIGRDPLDDIEIVGPQFVSFGKVEVKDWDGRPAESLAIRNTSATTIKLALTVEYKRRDDWLEVPSTFHLPPHAQRSLEVKLKPGAAKWLRLGRIEARIVLSGSRGIPVTLQLVRSEEGPPPPKEPDGPGPESGQLQVESLVVLEDAEPARWSEVAPKQVTITNRGRLPWTGRVRVRADWIVVQPLVLNLPPGGTAELEVRLKPTLFAAAQLVYDDEAAIIISSDRETYPVHVRMGGIAVSRPVVTSTPEPVSPPVTPGETVPGPFVKRPIEEPPVFSAMPLNVDFGQVTDWTTANPQLVTIVNHSDRPIDVTATAVDWLQVVPSEIHCPANLSQSFQVLLKKRLSAFDKAKFKGRLFEPRAVVIAVGNQEIPVSVTVETG